MYVLNIIYIFWTWPHKEKKKNQTSNIRFIKYDLQLIKLLLRDNSKHYCLYFK